MTKRMGAFRVTLDFPLPDGTILRRGIAVSALIPQSAVRKATDFYSKKGSTPTVVSVISLTATDES